VRPIDVDNVKTGCIEARQNLSRDSSLNPHYILQSGRRDVVKKQLIYLFSAGSAVHLPINVSVVSFGVKIRDPWVYASNESFKVQITQCRAK
jgi:hypothetical protein